jgi:hypothetical protein
MLSRETGQVPEELFAADSTCTSSAFIEDWHDAVAEWEHEQKKMTATMLAMLLLFLNLSGCSHGASIDQTAAQQVSDSFMADLIAHRTDAALDKMEPEFINMVNRADFAPQLEKLFKYCGWPLDSKLKQVGTGTKIHLDGHPTPIRKFTYAAATREYPKGGCYFSIDVAPVETV